MKLFDLYYALGIIIVLSATILIFRHSILKSYDGVGSGKKLLVVLVGLIVVFMGIGTVANGYDATGLYRQMQHLTPGNADYNEVAYYYNIHMNAARNFVIAGVIAYAGYIVFILRVKKQAEEAFKKVKNKWNWNVVENK